MLTHFPERVFELWFAGETKGRRGTLIQQAEGLDIPVIRKKKERFQELSSDGNHQGIALSVRAQEYTPLSRLLEATNPLIVAFDQVTDPRNGASLRSAECTRRHWSGHYSESMRSSWSDSVWGVRRCE